MAKKNRRSNTNDTAVKHKETFETLYSQRGCVPSWAANIPDHGNLYLELGYHRRNAEILSRAEGKAQYILDLGCGTGDLLLSLSKMAKYVVGAEMTEANITSCRQNVSSIQNILLCHSMAEHLPFKTSTFDKIILADVIEHVLDERQTLNEINRVLRPQGFLILTTPNKRVDRFWACCDAPVLFVVKQVRMVRAFFLREAIAKDIKAKDQLLSVSELKKLLEETGFSIVEHTTTEFYPRSILFGFFLKILGNNLRTKIALPVFRKIFRALERPKFFNYRQMTVAQKSR